MKQYILKFITNNRNYNLNLLEQKSVWEKPQLLPKRH